MPVIPALRRLRQKGHEFEVSLDYIERPCLQRGKKKIKKETKACGIPLSFPESWSLSVGRVLVAVSQDNPPSCLEGDI
jgi:hypothetical protein